MSTTTYKDASGVTRHRKGTGDASSGDPFVTESRVDGTVAHDAADAGPPVKVGARATASVAGGTLVSAGDRTDALAGLDGVPIVRPHCSLEDIVSGTASNTDGSSTQVVAAQGAGLKIYVASVLLVNTSASDVVVELKSAGTTKAVLPVPAGGGCSWNPPVPMPMGTNEAVNFDPSAAATTVYCTVVGFKSKV